uniref:MULE transposase domain-containing protein n=1 Tax=Panagrolaimus sp. JU765 TaxID=591449 RepID=A0AC34Q2S0_9BILA
MDTGETSLKRNFRKIAAPVVAYECNHHFGSPELAASNYSGNILRLHRLHPRPLMLLFDDKAKDIIRNCKIVVMDGTFEKRPRPHDGQNTYRQVYTIVAVYEEMPTKLQTFVVGIAFMGEQTREAYEELFNELRNLLENDLGIRKEIRLDHEVAAINAASNVFPEWPVKSCYFHYQKNLREFAQRKTFSTEFANSDSFQRWFRQIVGASHLPLPVMTAVIEHLLENPPPVPHLANDFATYY